MDTGRILALQPPVLRVCFLQDWDVGISVFQKREEVLICCFRFSLIACQGISAAGEIAGPTHSSVDNQESVRVQLKRNPDLVLTYLGPTPTSRTISGRRVFTSHLSEMGARGSRISAPARRARCAADEVRKCLIAVLNDTAGVVTAVTDMTGSVVSKSTRSDTQLY